MDLFNFAEYVRDNIMKNWAREDVIPEIIKVTKNNNVEFTGIIFKQENNNICPTIYLEIYYDMYINGVNLEEILNAIRIVYDKSEHEADCLRASFTHLGKNRDMVIIRLINYYKNKKILENAPYIPFHDLAISFRWIVKKDENGMASALVTNEDMEKWGISVSELYRLASDNTRRMFSYRIDSMFEKLRKVKDEYLNFDINELNQYTDNKSMLYVLSNDELLNGASSLLYPGVIESCAEIAGGNIYIIPSSVHEIIFVNEEGTDLENLKSTLKEINNSVVSETDILSDNIYYYDRKMKKITIA